MADYPINQILLDESLKLKEERKVLQNRLEKIMASRQQVSASVYQRVLKDYENRLEEIHNRLLDKKQDIDRELAGLYETRDKIQGNVKNHKDNLEELQFRHTLGEFDKQDFQQQAKAEEEKISRFEQVFNGVKGSIEKYESLFDEGDFENREEVSEVSAQSGHGTPLTAEEIDAWEEEAKAAQEALQEEPVSDADGEHWMEETKPEIHDELVTHSNAGAKGAKAQLTIISGAENVGKSFRLNGSAFTIGRSHNNQIILKEGKVSRQHAEIKLHGSDYVILDLNSSNGTKVNGDKVREHILQANDEIEIGGFVLQFQK